MTSVASLQESALFDGSYARRQDEPRKVPKEYKGVEKYWLQGWDRVDYQIREGL